MRYIRTKDGVYEATDYLEDGCWCLNNGGAYFRKADIIKEADIIEELCDCYVLEFDNGNRVVIDADEYCNYEKHVRKNCYGAIWTNKGLIYVAKMNENGEFELI